MGVAAFFLWVASGVPSEAVLDLDGNGYSDIWEKVYEVDGLDPGDDPDGDGLSNLEESVFGTDPLDPESRFAFEGYSFDDDHSILSLDLRVLAGRRYFIESSLALGGDAGWRVDKIFQSSVNGQMIVECPLFLIEVPKRFFRVRQELDEDGDGLTTFEEMALGLDDRDSNSGGLVSGGDFAWVMAQLTEGESFPLQGGGELTGFERTPFEVSRFLNQTTFGPTMEMIEEMSQSGKSYREWIDEQIALPATTILGSMEKELELGVNDDLFLFRKAWWRSAVSGEDQLRQRMAFALSEILVISGQGSDLVRGSSEASGTYYDLLVNGAFGNYVDLLEDVTYSVSMGSYLGHLRNFKADPELGTFPDENYARELMQLFSIGLWELNQDGSRKLDHRGDFIPTYTNFHITELAKVMTGFNWARTSKPIYYNFYPGLPMKIFNEAHEQGEKFLVNGGYLPAGLGAGEDVRRAVEHLGRHPNVGPFLGRHLIQRFVTSNPSPGYIERVAGVYRDNGNGEVGDLAAVIRAVLLDPEARALQVRDNPGHGKMREPYVTYVHLVRAFDSRNHSGTYAIHTTDGHKDMGQIPLDSPTVFNFFSPDHQPAELRDEGLIVPEFEILTPLRSVRWANLLKRGIEIGVDPRRMASTTTVFHHDYSDEFAALDDIDQLIDRLDLMFTYGTLGEGEKEIIRTMASETGPRERRLHNTIYLVMTSPEFAILR